MPKVTVIGGGLAGLATAAALGSIGFEVDLFESRGFLGGRATSYPLSATDENSEIIDNCQHILLRCCVNLLDFYKRLSVVDRIKFFREFYFIEPGGRTSVLRAGGLPAPFHFAGSLREAKFLTLGEKIAVARGLMAIRLERGKRADLEKITMLDWLREKRQPEAAIRRFWSQVLVSAVNEDLDKMAASHGFQVFGLGFLGKVNSYEMGVPAVPLGDLYASDAWSRMANVRIHLRAPVERLVIESGSVRGIVSQGKEYTSDYFISALPFERVESLVPEIIVPLEFEHSPITGIHLWFDRSVTQLLHATLLDRTIQWMFNKSGGRYLQLVVSASRSLVDMSRNDVIELALRELREFLPLAASAKIEKAHVVKEVRATFSAKPGLEQLRPVSVTRFPNFFLAGDWTRSGWPGTMEGAVRSGYLAAEAVAHATGRSTKFVLPDIG